MSHASFCTIAPVVTSVIAGTVDLPTKSGSPFKYASSRDDNIKKYFTVLQDSKDYGRLTSRYENVLPFYSIKQRVIYLFADKIISSHPDENILNPFYGKNGDLYSGFITSEKYFLQHGVTKDNISRWLRKFDKDLSLIVTVSDMERQSFLVKDYGIYFLFHANNIATVSPYLSYMVGLCSKCYDGIIPLNARYIAIVLC